MKTNSNLNHSEAKIQADCYTWFNNSYPHLRKLFYHIPNGEKRDPRTAAKLKAMGLVPGAPDCPFHYRGKTYFFEFKKPKTGKASDDQLEFHEALKRQNFLIFLPESLEEFQGIIKNIIELKNPLFTNGVSREEYFYKHKIFDYLYSLGDAELVILDTICNDDTRNRFINIVCEFMDENFDSLAGFDILFTPDFKAIYKKEDGSERPVFYNGSCIVE